MKYIQDRLTLELVPADEYYAGREPSSPMVIADIQPYKSMVTGEIIQGRRQHREHLKQHRMIEVGTDTSHMNKRNEIQSAPGLRHNLDEAMKRYNG